MNRERIEETVRLWQAEPDKAKGKPTVIARAEGSKAVMEHGSFSWRTDMPVSLGGTNEAPSPTALLLSALAGCAVVFIRDTLAPQLGVTVDAIKATALPNLAGLHRAQCETDARASGDGWRRARCGDDQSDIAHRGVQAIALVIKKACARVYRAGHLVFHLGGVDGMARRFGSDVRFGS